MGSTRCSIAFWPRGSKMVRPMGQCVQGNVVALLGVFVLCHAVSSRSYTLSSFLSWHFVHFGIFRFNSWILITSSFLLAFVRTPSSLLSFFVSEAGAPWLLLSRYVLSLRAFWTRILPSVSHSTLLHSATFVLCRRVLRMMSHGVSPEDLSAKRMSTEETSQPPCLVLQLASFFTAEVFADPHLWRWWWYCFLQSFSSTWLNVSVTSCGLPLGTQLLVWARRTVWARHASTSGDPLETMESWEEDTQLLARNRLVISLRLCSTARWLGISMKLTTLR